MCAEKIQRIMMAIMLSISMYLFTAGMIQYGVMLQTFIIFVVIIWAITDFCPSLWVLQKLVGKCDKKG
jgi:hypothetical protein